MNDNPDDRRLVAAHLDDDGAHVTLGLDDGSVHRVSLEDRAIPANPPVVLVEPDEVRAGVVLVRLDGTIEDASLPFLLEGPRPSADSASELAPRVAERIRSLRAERGWAQRETATRLDMAASNYARLESGRHVPSTATIARLAECFGVPLSHLVSVKNPTRR